MRKAKLILASMVMLASFAACTSTECENKEAKVSKKATVAKEMSSDKAELKVKRVQSAYKKLMAEKIAENEELKAENAKLQVKVKRTQNAFKDLLAKKIEEIEKLKAENATLQQGAEN
jgi:hypothetical protein